MVSITADTVLDWSQWGPSGCSGRSSANYATIEGWLCELGKSAEEALPSSGKEVAIYGRILTKPGTAEPEVRFYHDVYLTKAEWQQLRGAFPEDTFFVVEKEASV